jgi:A/G-specific adenine glycosylase
LNDGQGIMLENRDFFQSAIIEWYKNSKRCFPWRQTNDPFKIIIAEITLKLTGAWKAEKVYTYLIDHYETPEKMARANQSGIRPLFKTLGLYNRSQTLIYIAKEISDRFDGRVPNSYEDLTSIKGIGPYTAYAVLCFAYNQKVPIVDGSVSRIFQRCFNYKGEKKAYADKDLWQLAWDCLPDKNWKEYNLGLLDLGALVCKHKKPLHEGCPLKTICYTLIYPPAAANV